MNTGRCRNTGTNYMWNSWSHLSIQLIFTDFACLSGMETIAFFLENFNKKLICSQMSVHQTVSQTVKCAASHLQEASVCNSSLAPVSPLWCWSSLSWGFCDGKCSKPIAFSLSYVFLWPRLGSHPELKCVFHAENQWWVIHQWAFWRSSASGSGSLYLQHDNST